MAEIRIKGYYSAESIEPTVEAPLDKRTFAPTKECLYSKEWWNGAILYNGLYVVVLDADSKGNPAIYILKDKEHVELESSWKLSSGSNTGIIVDGTYIDPLSGYVHHSEGNLPGGYPILGDDGKIMPDQLPNSIQDVVTVNTYDDLPEIGENNNIYVIKYGDSEHPARSTYRWAGKDIGYIQISTSLIIGEIVGTAYDGGKGYSLEKKVMALEDLIGTKEDIVDTSLSIILKLERLIEWYEVK